MKNSKIIIFLNDNTVLNIVNLFFDKNYNKDNLLKIINKFY